MRANVVLRWVVPCALALTVLVPGLSAETAPAHAEPAADVACDRAHAPGTVTVPVTSGGLERPVLVHVPLGYDGQDEVPLVFNLHGSGGTGAGQLTKSGLAATADQHAFIVASPTAAIPNGGGFSWNIPGVPLFGSSLPPDDAADDVAYVGDIIDSLAAVLCVDTTRVYATGESGGGRMTSWLGCHLADEIAAIAPVVGLRAGNPDPSDPTKPDPATCTPSRPMPVIAFSGTNDATNPFPGGGQGYWLYGVPAAEQRWAEIDGCATGPVETPLPPSTVLVSYEDCADDVRIVSHRVLGAGHAWEAVADNEAMWEFLSGYRLPRALPAPSATTLPQIAGETVVGRELSADLGSWDQDGLDLAVQWLRDGDPIAGATATQHLLDVDDVGHRVSVEVTAAREDGVTGTARSAETAAVAKAAAVLATRLADQTPRVRKPIRLTVRLHALPVSVPATGRVTVLVDGRPVRKLDVGAGTARTRLRFAKPGRHRVVVRYPGSPGVMGARKALRVRAHR